MNLNLNNFWKQIGKFKPVKENVIFFLIISRNKQIYSIIWKKSTEKNKSYSIIQGNKRLQQFENHSNYEFIETETKFKLEKSA